MTQEAKVVKWNCPCGNSYTFHGFTEAAQRTWVGLTDEDVMSIAFNFDVSSLSLVAKAIEAKLKEKNT
jgi:hypothetical protein